MPASTHLITDVHTMAASIPTVTSMERATGNTTAQVDIIDLPGMMRECELKALELMTALKFVQQALDPADPIATQVVNLLGALV